MKDETKEIKVSEKMERGGQSELDDNALEQAAGGKSSLELGEEAWKKVKNIIYGADNSQ